MIARAAARGTGRACPSRQPPFSAPAKDFPPKKIFFQRNKKIFQRKTPCKHSEVSAKTKNHANKLKCNRK
jgi:hypothetical protein